MGTAWAGQRSYPWEQGQYVGGIKTVKVNITLCIYLNKWHVYASLAILNPSVCTQIDSDIVREQKTAEESLRLHLNLFSCIRIHYRRHLSSRKVYLAKDFIHGRY